MLSTVSNQLHYPNWGLYKNIEPIPMLKRGRKYGIYYQNTTHKLKVYDKTFEMKNNNNYSLNHITNSTFPKFKNDLLRIEKQTYAKTLSKSKLFRNHPINTIRDLCNIYKYSLLADDLHRTLKDVELKSIQYNLEKLTPAELRIIGYMENTQLRTHMRKEHRDTYKRDCKKHKVILTNFRSITHDVLLCNAKEKLNFYINN